MLKADIKAMANEQKTLKQNRKTVHFKGERIMPASHATWKVQENKNQLRHMYLAYGKARGRDLETIDRNYEDCSMKMVETLLQNYGIETPVCAD